MKNVAIIPVRGGSKSIPLKNIKLMYNRPLVYWTIDAAISCQYIEKVYVLTDSSEIENIVKSYDKESFGKLEVLGRSKETSTDTASTESVMLEFAENIDSEVIVLLQATSPLTTVKDLEKAFEKFKIKNYDSMLSVVNQKRFLWDYKDGRAVAKNYNIEERPRRQDFLGYYVENGAFYITKTKLLKQSKNRLSGNIGFYEMPEETYFEIDEPSDWGIVEKLLERRIESNIIKSCDIKLFATDCDGVLTDAGMYYSETGEVLKKFNTKDGMGFALLKDKNIKTAILTGENSEIVTKRAEKLNIDDVYLGCINKVEVMDTLLKKYNLKYNEVAYIGDDLNDVELLKKVGISFATSDANPAVKKIVDIVLNSRGGEGAFREAVDYLLSNRN